MQASAANHQKFMFARGNCCWRPITTAALYSAAQFLRKDFESCSAKFISWIVTVLYPSKRSTIFDVHFMFCMWRVQIPTNSYIAFQNGDKPAWTIRRCFAFLRKPSVRIRNDHQNWGGACVVRTELENSFFLHCNLSIDALLLSNLDERQKKVWDETYFSSLELGARHLLTVWQHPIGPGAGEDFEWRERISPLSLWFEVGFNY